MKTRPEPSPSATTAHMKMRPRSIEGGIITIKAYQKTTRKCYKGERCRRARNGAYRLETLERGTILRTWNVANLKFYFS